MCAYSSQLWQADTPGRCRSHRISTAALTAHLPCNKRAGIVTRTQGKVIANSSTRDAMLPRCHDSPSVGAAPSSRAYRQVARRTNTPAVPRLPSATIGFARTTISKGRTHTVCATFINAQRWSVRALWLSIRGHSEEARHRNELIEAGGLEVWVAVNCDA